MCPSIHETSPVESLKTAAVHKETVAGDDVPVELTRLETIQIDNYHGIHANTVIVYIALLFIGFTQLFNVVGAGAFARDVAAVVGGSEKQIWLSQAIVILTVVLGPIVAQAADFWGRKWFLVVLTSCAVIGSIVVSRATTMSMAIAGEVICGLSYGSQPLYYAVASEILPRKFRPAAQGGINAALGLGGITGLLAGSQIIKTYPEGFRIFWYTNAGITAVAAIILAMVYNPPPRPLQLSLTVGEKLGRLDWVGYALLAIGVVLFAMGLSWADNPYPWTDSHVLAPLLVGAAFLIGLVVHQRWLKKDGLLHHGLFKKDRNFALALFVIFVEGMVFYCPTVYYPFQVSVLYETDPVRVSLRASMVFFAAIVSSIAIAVYSSIRKTVRAPIVVSFLCFVIFFGLMASANPSSSKAVWGYPVFLGVGLGLCLTCLVTVAQLSAPPALIAITSGLLIAIRSFGATIALSITGAILHSSLSKNLGAKIAAAVLPLGLSPEVLPQFIGALTVHDIAALQQIPGVTPSIIQAGSGGLALAYTKAFQGVWIFGAVLSFVAAIVALFFVEPTDMTMHVDAPLDREQ